jgi:hypothetical protein
MTPAERSAKELKAALSALNFDGLKRELYEKLSPRLPEGLRQALARDLGLRLEPPKRYKAADELIRRYR